MMEMRDFLSFCSSNFDGKNWTDVRKELFKHSIFSKLTNDNFAKIINEVNIEVDPDFRYGSCYWSWSLCS